MIFLHADLIDDDFLLFCVLVLSTAFVVLAGFTIHEASHAVMADTLGDPTPRRLGTLTLDPRVHLEPLSVILVFLFGFGWAKTLVSPGLTRVNPRLGSFLISIAGPVSHFVVAAVLSIPLQLNWVPYIDPFWDSDLLLRFNTDFEFYAGLFLTGAVYLNCLLGIFNLMPVPPLDGFKALLAILPDDLAFEAQKLERHGLAILLLLIFGIPFLTYYATGESFNPVWEVINPAVEGMVEFLTGSR